MACMHARRTCITKQASMCSARRSSGRGRSGRKSATTASRHSWPRRTTRLASGSLRVAESSNTASMLGQPVLSVSPSTFNMHTALHTPPADRLMQLSTFRQTASLLAPVRSKHYRLSPSPRLIVKSHSIEAFDAPENSSFYRRSHIEQYSDHYTQNTRGVPGGTSG